MNRTTRIKPVSDRRRKELAFYARLKRGYLKAHRWCVVNHTPATEVHHSRGRSGRLLCDVRFWLPVSFSGHRWIHDHPAEARRHGWIGEVGTWNSQPVQANGLHSGD